MELTAFQLWRTRAYLFLVGVTRHVTLGVRVAAIDGQRVLLVRQTYLPGWHFPGGGVEPGETPEFAGGREMEEETGYRARGPMSLHGLFLAVNRATNRDYIAMYVCRDAERVRDARPDREVAEIGWFAATALPEGVTEATRARIAEIFDGTAPGPMW